MKKLLALTLVLTAPLTAFAATKAAAPAKAAPMFIQVPQLSLETANKIADATIAACRTKGLNVAVTVVDRFGIPMVMQRDTLASSLPVQISLKKAYTAVTFNSKTSALKSQAGSALAHADDILFSAGAAPIEAGGKIFGAVGVSGAPDGMDDEACALAGIDAVIADLEMQ